MKAPSANCNMKPCDVDKYKIKVVDKAGDKVPDSVRFVDRLPRTETGKVRRVELAREVLAKAE